MDKALEVDLVAVWVGAGSDVEGRHVATLKGLSDGLHISDQMRVVCSHDLVPGHHGTIVMLENKEVRKNEDKERGEERGRGERREGDEGRGERDKTRKTQKKEGVRVSE